MIQQLLKVGRFGVTGLIATGINYGLYLFLVDTYLPPIPATMVAYSSSVVLNFFLQRYFVFELKRSLRSAFALSMLVSVGGLMLDAFLIYLLHRYPLFGTQEWLIKLMVTGGVFIYNFYWKRRVFEGSTPPVGGAVRRERMDILDDITVNHSPSKSNLNE